MKLIYSILFILFVFKANCQQFGQIYYNFLNPIMMDAEAYPGYSLGLNMNYKKIGFEFEFANTGKKHENRYRSINPQIKYLFHAKSKDLEKDRYHYITVGYLGFKAFKSGTFTGRAENLTPPAWDSLESALVYNEYRLAGWAKSPSLQIGYEKVTEKHVTGAAPTKTAIFNPLGRLVGWLINYDDLRSYRLDYTRIFRFSLFAAMPEWLNFEATEIKPSAGSALPPWYPQQNVVLEPTMKNLIGFRIGISWRTLKPIGFTFGLEGTMVPGIFNVHGVYGRGFPDDNIFLKVNLGLAIGYSTKNKD